MASAFQANAFQNNAFQVETTTGVMPVGFFGDVGLSEDDYKKFRDKVEELTEAGKLSREEAERLKKEFDGDIYAAFFPEEAKAQPEIEPEAAAAPASTNLIVPRNPTAIRRAFAIAAQKEQEEEEMISLLLAA